MSLHVHLHLWQVVHVHVLSMLQLFMLLHHLLCLGIICLSVCSITNWSKQSRWVEEKTLLLLRNTNDWSVDLSLDVSLTIATGTYILHHLSSMGIVFSCHSSSVSSHTMSLLERIFSSLQQDTHWITCKFVCSRFWLYMAIGDCQSIITTNTLNTG